MSRTRRQPDLPMVLWSLSLLLILGAIAGGLMITGGPAHQRALKMDANRAGDLGTIQHSLAEYYDTHRTLPATLAALNDLEDDDRLDPVTRQPYAYQRNSPITFKLCAVYEAGTRRNKAGKPDDIFIFLLASGESDNTYYYDPYDLNLGKNHANGRVCYALQVEKNSNASSNDKFRIRKR